MNGVNVYLVGAGPGDPELITLKGKRILESAEVVIFDRLVGPAILDFTHPAAERVYVGKDASFHTLPQDEINDLIIEKAKTGKRVVRLKGGDPYLFGRGAEEAEALYKAGISFEVIAGVSAAAGMASYAGIPLTDRHLSSAVTFITGHKRVGERVNEIDWPAIAALNHTIVFYMPVRNLSLIVKKLIDCGKSPNTPAAVVMSATISDQKTVTAMLYDIEEKAIENEIRPPALFVVGDVVAMKDRLGWFEGH